MCDIQGDFTSGMEKARLAAIEAGTRVGLLRYTAEPLPAPLARLLGIEARPAIDHYAIVELDHPEWLKRRGKFTAELAGRKREHQLVSAGISQIEVFLGGEPV